MPAMLDIDPGTTVREIGDQLEALLRAEGFALDYFLVYDHMPRGTPGELPWLALGASLIACFATSGQGSQADSHYVNVEAIRFGDDRPASSATVYLIKTTQGMDIALAIANRLTVLLEA